MSQMLPDGEVMRRGAAPAARASPATPDIAPTDKISDNKELLRQQLLSASKERGVPKQARPRHKNRWKLKFHHQALPQEYLDHYEQTLQKANARAIKQKAEKPKPEVDVNNLTNETFKIWAQRLAGIQSDTTQTTAVSVDKTPRTEEKRKKAPTIAPSKIVTYDDLPYMGEMTLNNSKPRRGRKPKKADICHLIYENYGTVVPGQPPPQTDKLPQLSPAFRSDTVSTPKTDLQNKIISNLLERKLSAEKKRLDPPSALSAPDGPPSAAPRTRPGPLHRDDEPLNLCVRDLRDLKLHIQRKFGDIYTCAPEVKTEPTAEEQPNAISVIQRNTNAPSTPSPSPSASSSPPVPTAPPAWLCVHPLALQYCRALVEPTAQPALAENNKKLVLKQISELLDPSVILQQSEEKRPEHRKRSSPVSTVQAPAKRKRSAIFIPPVPAQTNSSTPNTEVSICKFKFTGGSKPTLQEKKMLSVDSGGNFRYYSGSKGTKGYEYMQRDNSQRTETSISSAPSQPEQLSKEDLSKKKRKSRKSLQREKLEQTFREKGFLIQTQQLQSAEGATYCKFRQLRKFTRYLFRSWKDYLPGELDDRSGTSEGAEHKPLETPPPLDGTMVGEW